MTTDTQRNQSSSVILVIAIFVVIVLTVFGIWYLKSNSSDNVAMRRITYQVESTGGYAFIIYTDSNGNNTEGQMYATPFTRTFTLPRGQEVYLTASNPSQSGSISCKIKIDNRDWKESRGTHPIDSIACGGIVK